MTTESDFDCWCSHRDGLALVLAEGGLGGHHLDVLGRSHGPLGGGSPAFWREGESPETWKIVFFTLWSIFHLVLLGKMAVLVDDVSCFFPIVEFWNREFPKCSTAHGVEREDSENSRKKSVNSIWDESSWSFGYDLWLKVLILKVSYKLKAFYSRTVKLFHNLQYF